MPTAKISRGEIHYDCKGAGDPVVMVLAQSTGPKGVGPFIDRLARDFMVVRFDALGNGRSSPVRSAGDVSMAARAEEVIGVLDDLGLAKARLCCHSTGCGIGLTVAANDPERVAGLALMAPWTHGDPYLTVMQHLRVAAARALAPADYERFNASLVFPPVYRRANEAGFTRLAETAAAPDADRIADRLNGILAFDARPLLAAIACPALVVSATDDQLMPAWFGREMAAGIPGARLIELDEAGHMIPETKGAELAAQVAEFFAGTAAK